MSVAKQLIGVLLGLVIVAALIFYGMPGVRDSYRTPELVEVEVHLTNLCGVRDDTFIVREPVTGISARFSDGVAHMRLLDNRKIQLAVSPAYPNFVYDGELVQVSKVVKLVADCSSSPRQRQFFGTMRDQFNK